MEPSHLKAIEQGEVIPTLEDIFTISNCLNASMDYLCKGELIPNDISRMVEELSRDKQKIALRALEYFLK